MGSPASWMRSRRPAMTLMEGGSPHASSPMQQQQALIERGDDFADDPAVENPVMQRQYGQGRFFEETDPEAFYPPGEVPWGPEHPLWLAFMKGDVKVVRDVTGQEHLISREAYAAHDHIPKEDLGTGDKIQMDLLASFGRIKYDFAKTLVAYLILDPLFASSPLQVQPIQASTAVPPVGGAIATGQLDFGHRGTPQRVIFDLPPSQIIKAPFAGSFGMLSARLRPKYYTNMDAGAGPSIRNYLAFPGGPVLTSELWSSTQMQTMQQNGFSSESVAGVPFPTLSHGVRGWLAEGFLSNDADSKPIRRFYGTISCNGTINTQEVFCPVAFASNFVELTGGASNATSSTEVLQFFQVGLPTSAVATQLVGPFPPNQKVPLIYGCQNIVVVNGPTAVGGMAVPLEVPFELDFFLSF